MELKGYLNILNRRKWVVILTLLATVAVVGLGTLRQQPAYSATTTVRVAQASSGSVEYVDYMYAERLMNTYIEMLKSSATLEQVIAELGLSTSPKELVEQIEAGVVPNTELLSITVTDYSPAQAADIANALARFIVERSRDLYFGGTKSAREILQQRLDEVEAELDQHRAELQTLTDQAAAENAQVDALKAQIGSEEQVYASLLSQYEQARLAEASRENSVTVFVPAVAPTAVVEGAAPEVAYRAAATVRITQQYNASSGYTEYVYLERLMNTYAELLKSETILAKVIADLGLKATPNALLARTVIEVLPNTELLRITVGDSRADRASNIANALAAVLVEQGQALYSGETKSAREILQQQLTAIEDSLEQDRAALQGLLDNSTQDNARMDALEMKIQSEEAVYLSLLRQYEEVRVTEASRESSAAIVAAASPPEAPSRPRVKLNLALGTLVGAVAGVALAILFEYMDPTLHSTDDLEAVAAASVLGVIPRFAVRGSSPHQILLSSNGHCPAGEAFRMLKGNLLSAASTRPLKTLLVTSAEEGVGKSTVVANLAVSMADAGLNVVVVDADSRRPSLHEMFGLPNDLGLSTVLLDLDQLKATVRDSGIRGVRVLTSGPTPDNPAELTGLPAMQELVAELAKGSDVVLLDSPPILAVAETAALAPMVDGVLLVAAQDQTSKRGVQRALRHLGRIRADALGIVFNKATDIDAGYYHYYHEGERTSYLRSLSRVLRRRS